MRKKRISSTALARSLGDILNRVHYRGKSFIVLRNGKEIAVLTPHSKPERKILRQVLEPWIEARKTDPEWGELLEKIGRDDRPLENPWESSSTPAR